MTFELGGARVHFITPFDYTLYSNVSANTTLAVSNRKSIQGLFAVVNHRTRRVQCYSIWYRQPYPTYLWFSICKLTVKILVLILIQCWRKEFLCEVLVIASVRLHDFIFK